MVYKFSKVIWIFDKVLMKQSSLVKKENLTGNHFCNHSFNFVKIEYKNAENGYKFERFDWFSGVLVTGVLIQQLALSFADLGSSKFMNVVKLRAFQFLN